MSTLDLFSDDFPHGTRKGFELGCKSNGGCLNHGTGVQTCVEADVRLNRDWEYQKLIQAGMSELEAAEELGKPTVHVPRSETVAVPVKETPLPIETRPIPHQAFSAAQEVAAAPRQKRARKVTASVPAISPQKRGRPAREIVHGTTAGFSKGCLTDEGCPGGPDGTTCSEENRTYKREWAANKAARLRAEAGLPEPTPGARRPRAQVSLREDLDLIAQLTAEVEKLREKVAKSYRWHLSYDKADLMWRVTLRNDQRVTCGMEQWFDSQAEAMRYIAEQSAAGAS